MKRKIDIIVLVAAVFCIFASGYCLATDNTPTMSPSNTSEIGVSSAQSVQQATNADATVTNIVSLKNVIENLSTNAPQNSRVTYLTSIDADNHTNVNIDVSKGTELLMDTDVTAYKVYITGDGTISFTSGRINSEYLYITAGTSMGTLPQINIASGTQTGAEMQISSSSDYAQIVSAGTIPITPNPTPPIETPPMPVVGPVEPPPIVVSVPGHPVEPPPIIVTHPIIVVAGPFPSPDQGNGSTMSGTVTAVENPDGVKAQPISKNPSPNPPKVGPNQPRVGADLGTTMDTPIKSDDKKKDVKRPTTYNPNRSLGDATLVGTVEEK